MFDYKLMVLLIFFVIEKKQKQQQEKLTFFNKHIKTYMNIKKIKKKTTTKNKFCKFTTERKKTLAKKAALFSKLSIFLKKLL